MYLACLNYEEKEIFIEMAFKIANIDNEYSKEEQQLIEAYKLETGIEEIKEENTLEEIIDYYSTCEPIVQKIIWFEIYSLINADEKITSSEKTVTDLIKSKFTIDINVLEKIEELVRTLNSAIIDLTDIIFEKKAIIENMLE